LVGVEQWADAANAVRAEVVDQGDRAADGPGSQHGAAGAAVVERAEYERPPAGSKLDPFKGEIHRLLKGDPKLTGQRIRELIAPLGFAGGKTIVDDYLREVRPPACGQGIRASRGRGERA
jgi:hypothetical protein